MKITETVLVYPYLLGLFILHILFSNLLRKASSRSQGLFVAASTITYFLSFSSVEELLTPSI